MLFNSLTFLIFVAIFFAIWPAVRSKHTLKYLFIVMASFTFYAFWDLRFLFLFIVIGLVDYSVGLAIQRYPGRKKGLVAVSIINSVSWLLLFKYSNFITSNIDSILEIFSIDFRLRTQLPELMLIGPVGLSFYSLMSISYVIDTYQERIIPTRNPLQYLAYLSFFPHLMCGPIIRAKDLLKQIEEKRIATEDQRWEATVLISRGFFKKLALADNFAPIVNNAFTDLQFNPSGVYWWMTIIFFAAQVYCDFSGYSDIARGLFKAMGYDIPLNFDHPFTALSMRELWRRWHMSLSGWFRDYVYIPMGGAKASSLKIARNLLITFILSGVWHGAEWHFAAWGGIHGLFLSLERWTKWPSKLIKFPLGKILCLALVLFQFLVALVFFRAESLSQAGKILSSMFTHISLSSASLSGFSKYSILLLGILILREGYIFASSQFRFELNFVGRRTLHELHPALLMLLAVYLRGPGSAFVYFQF
jgi:alginate O-acetyltransferase complex protein AlgI